MDIAFLMDGLESIDPSWETTSHLMYECNQRGHTVYFLEPHDVYIRNNRVVARMWNITVPRDLGLAEYWKCLIQCLKKDDPDECSRLEIQHYFSENMDFPAEAKEMNDPIEYVSFLVQADGHIDKENIQVLKQDPQCRECAAEALTLIRKMPKWQPAMKGATPVAARVTVPVRFVLQIEPYKRVFLHYPKPYEIQKKLHKDQTR